MLSRVVVLSLLLVFATAGSAFGQAGTAVITGTVTNPTGSAVLDAKIVVRDPLTGFVRGTLTNETGNYNLPGLRPSTYEITIEAAGFRRHYQPGFRLEVGQSARVDVGLEVGQVSEQIEVRGTAQLLSSEHATVGSVIDQRKIVDLPLNGRNFVSLALLVPGVNTGQSGAGAHGPHAEERAALVVLDNRRTHRNDSWGTGAPALRRSVGAHRQPAIARRTDFLSQLMGQMTCPRRADDVTGPVYSGQSPEQVTPQRRITPAGPRNKAGSSGLH